MLLKKKNKGTTLLELMVGFFILAGGVLIFIRILGMFKQETTYYSEHFLANSLNEKILEACYHETEINPYGLEALGLVDTSGTPTPINTAVTDGETVFFQDPAITQPNTKYLYSKLKDNFQLTVGCDSTPKKFYEITPGFRWNAKTGKGSLNSTCRFLAFTGKSEATSTYSLSDSAVKTAITKKVGRAGTGFASVFPNEDRRELMLNLGHLFYPLEALFPVPDPNALTQPKTLRNEFLRIESKKNSYPPSSDNYAKITKEYFNMARDMLHLLVYFKPRFQYIQDKKLVFSSFDRNNNSSISAARGDPKVYRDDAEDLLRDSLNYTHAVQDIFINCLLELVSRYEKQLDSIKLAREQRRIAIRVLNFYRILYVCRNQSNVILARSNNINTGAQTRSDFLDFLRKMRDYFEKRDATLNRMALQELSLLSPTENANYYKRYKVPQIVKELFECIEDLRNENLTELIWRDLIL